MFDVSFSELLVIAVVALLVIGPEKLPKVARTVGAFTGRMQRYVAQVREEVNREVRFEELQKLQSEIKQSVEQEKDALQAAINKTTDHAPSRPVKTKKIAKSTPKKRVNAKVDDTN
jgi:sec-independent protein translocase protein TatB